MQEKHDQADGTDDCRYDYNSYCWLKFHDLPPDDVVSVQIHLNDEEPPYCLDPLALKACADGGVAGERGHTMKCLNHEESPYCLDPSALKASARDAAGCS